jgi:hypothetical protein
MHPRFSTKALKSRKIFVNLLCTALLVLVSLLYVEAGAPPRAKPYKESICNTNPDVFFCEDFEGEDILNYGNPDGSATCDSRWYNPALGQNEDPSQPANFCWGGGGSYQINTRPIPGFAAQNRVWRIAKSQGYTDVVTGINTGTGDGSISGWLKPTLLGTGAREWYARIQVYFHPTHSWPADYDYKTFYALPRDFVDAPSAVYETGMTFHEDFWCGGETGIPDVPMIRYSNNFQVFPSPKYDGFSPWCPPLNPGQDPDGVHAPRFVKDRWYTMEYHYKLSSSPTSNDGILELWVDGKKAYSTTRNTCAAGCPNMGFIYILGFMNPRDPQTGYAEIDNVIISRRYIGPPGGSAPPDTTPPAPPTNLTAR